MNNYIKMCEQSEEIQKAWKPKDWDRFIYKDDRKLGIACVDDKYDKNEKYIWLPTQEQLTKIHFDWYLRKYKTKMLISEYLLYLGEFSEIVEESEYKYYSLKEIMLGYLYQEKYSKLWTGKKWIIIR